MLSRILMDFITNSLSFQTVIKLFGSLVVLVVVLLSRGVLARAVSRRVSNRELRRRWLASLRSGLFALLVLALISIWVETIQTFAVSTIAVAVALVIATKELSMCVLGSIVRVVGDSYSVGDRVVIGDHRGDVVDHNLLTTTLLEVGPDASSHEHSGRIITLPNSVLLSHPVTKEFSDTPYVLHTFTLPLRADADFREYERLLIEAARVECTPFLETVRQHWKRLAEAHDVPETSPGPHVAVQLSDTSRVDLVVRIPAPAGQQMELQEAITRRFLDSLQAHRSMAVSRVGE
jgi:small-conductance mechanosensitive channel